MASYGSGDVIRAAGNAYRVQEVLGVGGMGEVYLVLDHSLGTKAVLKLLRPAVAKASTTVRTRFVNEARVLARIRHRNVARVQTRGETEDGGDYFVMEHLEGLSLRSLVAARGALRLDVATNLGMQLFYGLQAIHDHGVIHRDIKPDNLIVHQEDGEQVLKIIDFGVMRLLDDETPEGFCGTPAYAAPEQLRTETITTRVDVFAAGCVFFELLVGHRPYEVHGVDERGAFERIDKPAPPIDRFGKFPRALVDLVASALELDPAERPDAITIGKQLQPICRVLPAAYDLNQVVTTEDLLKQRRDVQPITLADLQAPTDPDGPIPAWMHALRAQNEIAKVLGEPAPLPEIAGHTRRDPSLAHAATMEERPAVNPDAEMRRAPTREAPLSEAPRTPLLPRNGTEPLAPMPRVARPGDWPSPAATAATPMPTTLPSGTSPAPSFVHARGDSRSPGQSPTPAPVRHVSTPAPTPTPTPPHPTPRPARPKGRRRGAGGALAMKILAMVAAFVVVGVLGVALLMWLEPMLSRGPR